MRTNKIGILQTNNNSIKQYPKNSGNTEQKNEVEYSKYSTDNLKANYLVNFNGHIGAEHSSASNIGVLNQETHFFREPKTDEIVQNYILNNFADCSEINIVSGACATGDEAKSYAMMLDSLGDKLHVFGFDISSGVVQKAKDDTVKLLISIGEQIDFGIDLDRERFITDSSYTLNPYLSKCKEKFLTYYDKSGKKYKVPRFPESKKQLDDLRAIIQDEDAYKKYKQEKYEQEKHEYYEKQSKTKKRVKEFPPYNDKIYNRMIDTQIKNLEKQTRKYYKYQNYKAREGISTNCHFETGDIQNLENLYEPNSINVLLYRNALYHTLCEGDDNHRNFCADAQEKMDDIARQMNKVVVEQGLVVFGEDEDLQGVEDRTIVKSMGKNGFENLTQNGREFFNIWVKVKQVD